MREFTKILVIIITLIAVCIPGPAHANGYFYYHPMINNYSNGEVRVQYQASTGPYTLYWVLTPSDFPDLTANEIMTHTYNGQNLPLFGSEDGSYYTMETFTQTGLQSGQDYKLQSVISICDELFEVSTSKPIFSAMDYVEGTPAVLQNYINGFDITVKTGSSGKVYGGLFYGDHTSTTAELLIGQGEGLAYSSVDTTNDNSSVLSFRNDLSNFSPLIDYFIVLIRKDKYGNVFYEKTRINNLRVPRPSISHLEYDNGSPSNLTDDKLMITFDVPVENPGSVYDYSISLISNVHDVQTDIVLTPGIDYLFDSHNAETVTLVFTENGLKKFNHADLFENGIMQVELSPSRIYYAMDPIEGSAELILNQEVIHLGEKNLVSFIDNGGSPIEDQEIAYNGLAVRPVDPVRSGYTFAGWYTDEGLTIAYNFTTAVTGNVTLYAKWRKISSSGGTTTTNTIPVEQDGKTTQVPGTILISTGAGKTVTTIKADDAAIQNLISTGDKGTVITLPVTTGADVVVGQLNGQTVKDMENKEAVLQVKTSNVTYAIQASQINIDSVKAQVGADVGLKDIQVNVTIANSSAEEVKLVQDAAKQGNFNIIISPVNFTIECTYQDKKVDVSKFNNYVERLIAIPEGADPNKITTGIVFRPDGTFYHVPTKVLKIDGKYYAQINSLTNSTYAVVWNPKEFADVANHWSKAAVNNMYSRMVVSGVAEGQYQPDRAITRAEFAAIMVKGLGLSHLVADKTSFNDIKADTWYANQVGIASQYGIIKGYADGSFRPNGTIAREEAMTIIANAMKITKLQANVTGSELAKFTDADKASAWAKGSIAACVDTNIVTGRSGQTIAPKASITRAEVAQIMQNFLQKSGLIN